MPKRAELVTIGAVLRVLREAAGLSQEDLADEASIHRTLVGRYERAERNVGILTIRKVLRAMGVSWIDFGRELDKRDPLPRPSRRDDRRRG